MARRNITIPDDGFSDTIQKVVDFKRFSKQKSGIGTVGNYISVYPTVDGANKVCYEVMVDAAAADVDATLQIYKDATTGTGLLFDGYFANRDLNGDVHFPNGEKYGTAIIVKVGSGSGKSIINVKYD